MDSKRKISYRRLRQDPWIRELTQEVRLSPHQLIQPYFVVDGIQEKQSISGLTGVYRETPDSLLKQIEDDIENGVRKMILFSVPLEKKEQGFQFDFTTSQIEAIRKRFGKDLWISTDVCLCSFTSHGQCGILNPEGDHILNDSTTHELAQSALAFAQAGADCVAPSDMMDGRVGAIRNLLDSSGFDRTILMSYSAKFHSKFYGPFREAADSAPKGQSSLKDRATYQIDPTRPKDALNSSLRDAEEGADILMVKPGMPYLDLLSQLSQAIPLPWAVYQVSGEYASIELMAEKGLMDGPKAHVEAWTAFIRAGASMILTYGARHGRKWIQ